MYKFILSTMLIFFSMSCLSQVEDDDGTTKTDNYVFLRPASIYLCLTLDCSVTADTIEVAADSKFKLASLQDDGYAIIYFWTYNSPKSREKYNNTYTNNKKDSVTKYFKVKPTDWQNKVAKRYSTSLFYFRKFKSTKQFSGTSITGGVVLLPYKFRPKVHVDNERRGYDFSKDITLGVSGGIRQRISHYKPYYLNVVANFGISNVTQNVFNTDSALTESRDVPAFTIATGIVLDFKNIQFGIFLGWDKISDQNKNNWIYQGKPWLSVGFGYSIFSVSTAQSNAASGTNDK